MNNNWHTKNVFLQMLKLSSLLILLSEPYFAHFLLYSGMSSLHAPVTGNHTASQQIWSSGRTFRVQMVSYRLQRFLPRQWRLPKNLIDPEQLSVLK